ncbi:uncharacterized protein LOC115223175 isoform X1 [Argonauta hians]
MSAKVICIGVGIVLALVMIFSLVGTSLRKLQTYEVGLIYNKITRNLHDDPRYEGLHLGPPGYTFIKFPNVYQTMTFNDIVCLNKNGVRIVLDVSCQFKLQLRYMKKIVLEFKDFDGLERVLKYAGIAAIHEACSNFTTAEFQEKREIFQKNVQEIMEYRFEHLNTDISAVQVNDIKRPDKYEKAIRSKERAREDILVAQQERPQMLIEAQTKVKEANATAEITLEKARSRSRIKSKQAEAEAASILVQFEKEAESLKNVVMGSGLSFTTDQLLKYMANRILTNIDNPLHVAMKYPSV